MTRWLGKIVRLSCVFFFQAEDGIRDIGVTGVQTVCSSDLVYVAPGGSDANPCTAEAPCFTFKKAYASALPGWEVEVAEGTYGPQVIAAADKATPEDVEIGRASCRERV